MAPLLISLQMLLVFSCIILHATTVTCTNSSKWFEPIGDRVITVDVNGGGHFRSVQAAVNAVPENNRMNVLIQISAGYYMYNYSSTKSHFIYTLFHCSLFTNNSNKINCT